MQRKKIIIASSILVGLLVSCSTWEKFRRPQSTNFVKDVQSYKSELSRSPLTNKTCQLLPKLRQDVNETNVQTLTGPEVAEQGASLLQSLWEIRLRLHDNLDSLKSCQPEVRATFQTLRSVEDLIGDRFYNEKPLDAKDVDFNKIPPPILDPQYGHGYFVRPDADQKPFQFRSGDIMLTRGVTFFSSSLARIPNYQSQFSHFVLVHVDDKTKEASTIESYVSVGGVSVFKMVDALKNENARILLIRPKDGKLGKKAADIIMKRMRSGKPVKYDFQMDTDDDKRMTCAEVAYHGYRYASDGAFKIPENSSRLEPRLLDFMEDTGMKGDHILAPSDMEMDSRFDIVVEFRDYSVLRDSRYRDAIMSKIYQWMTSDQYQYELFRPISLSAVWLVRQTFLWPLAQKLATKFGKSLPDFSDEIPRSFFVTMATMKEVGDRIYPRLAEIDQQHVKTTGWHMTMSQLSDAMEEVRKRDLDLFLNNQDDTFHELFHRRDQRPKPMDTGSF